MKALDRKLASIAHGEYTSDDFVIADAKDADMAFGVQAPGLDPESTVSGLGGDFRTRTEYLDHMTQEVQAEAVDVLLTSASNGEKLALKGVLDRSTVTLAVRANDTTDIWNPRGGTYTSYPSRPFRTANLDEVRRFCNLVLYSVTFNNDLASDLATLQEYGRFRQESGTSSRSSTPTHRSGWPRRMSAASSTTTSCGCWPASPPRSARCS
jgi:hypothetical protein